ncbi:MAG: polysaccharide deacetylase family protein [Bacillota bacterium]|nr:polysaccharide deacetylase family protein [Bacillota bacterium]
MEIKKSHLKIAGIGGIFIASFVFGATLHCLKDHAAVSTSAPVESQAGNWGLGFGESGTQPTGNASPEELKTYHAAYCDPTDEKVIYLTFDAGFENGNTPAILDALKKHNAVGTFFVVGNFLETSPDLVKRMVKEGHLVANHTYHHPNMSKIASKEAFQKELQEVEELYQKITGEEMIRYYRPPQGKYSTDNLQMASELGYKTFFWSLAYVDWIQDQQPTKEEAFDKLLSRIHPGAIVLLHNTSSTNGKILDELLTKWEKMGYHFAPLSQLAEKL